MWSAAKPQARPALVAQRLLAKVQHRSLFGAPVHVEAVRAVRMRAIARKPAQRRVAGPQRIRLREAGRVFGQGHPETGGLGARRHVADEAVARVGDPEGSGTRQAGAGGKRRVVGHGIGHAHAVAPVDGDASALRLKSCSAKTSVPSTVRLPSGGGLTFRSRAAPAGTVVSSPACGTRLQFIVASGRQATWPHASVGCATGSSCPKRLGKSSRSDANSTKQDSSPPRAVNAPVATLAPSVPSNNEICSVAKVGR